MPKPVKRQERPVAPQAPEPQSTLLFWVVVPPLALFYLTYVLQIDLKTIHAFVSTALYYIFKPPLGHSTYGELISKTFANNDGSFTRHIVAVGDLHGDLPNAKKVLQFAGVTDASGKWSGNVDFFVQTGDIIDRFVKPTELATFGSIEERQEAITTGRIGRTWAANYTTTSRLPLHPSLGAPNTPFPSELDASDAVSPLSHSAISFVHGGLSPTYEDLTPFPTRINEISDSLFKKLLARNPQPEPRPPAGYIGLPATATDAEKAFYSSNGPVWYRGWALDPEEKVCAEVESVLEKTGTRRMIMGHTPDFKKIQSRCNGKIVIIDTGVSHAYGGVLSALSIQYTLTPIGPAEDKRWKEKEVVTAVYADKREVLVTDEREVVGDFAHN
ncbi:hypothetical protein H0H92_015083 [Tricholoma furcatifolium]|nr:hypothetical protein H0H92_015083 [Tricholoma furcatifolium]